MLLTNCLTNTDLKITESFGFGLLTQLVRVLPRHGRSHWFESSIAHEMKLTIVSFFLSYYFVK